MSLNREQYKSLLAQLAQNIATAEQQVALLKLQEKVSQLFLELNDSQSKVTRVPVSAFLNTIASSPSYFRFEDAGEMTLCVSKSNGIMTCYAEDCTTHFVGTELEELCKHAQWTDDRTEVKLRCCRIAPACAFICEQAPNIELAVTPAVQQAPELELVISSVTPAVQQAPELELVISSVTPAVQQAPELELELVISSVTPAVQQAQEIIISPTEETPKVAEEQESISVPAN